MSWWSLPRRGHGHNAYLQRVCLHCLPLHPEQKIALTQLRTIRTIWDAVLSLEKTCAAHYSLENKSVTAKAFRKQQKQMREASKKNIKSVEEHCFDRLKEVAWNDSQLAREIYLVCQENDWELTPALLEYATSIFGGPCQTKFELEDVFAHLTSVEKLSTLASGSNKLLDHLVKENHFLLFVQSNF